MTDSDWTAFSEDRQSEVSARVLDEGTLPRVAPSVLVDGIVVPLAFAIDHPFGAVLHLMLWDDEEDGVAPQCDVEVLVRRADGWSYVGSGGSGWPTSQLIDLEDYELGGVPLVVLGECGVEVPDVGIGSFIYGIASASTRGVRFLDSAGAEHQWPKMRCGAFVIPSRLVASRLTALR